MRGLFSHYNSNYKKWKDIFSSVMHEKDETHMSPLYWMGEPLAIMGYDTDKLSEMEKKVVNLLEQFTIMGERYTFILEGDLSTLTSFRCKTLS